MAKSNKPIVWSLFAAGGTLAAFLAPLSWRRIVRLRKAAASATSTMLPLESAGSRRTATSPFAVVRMSGTMPFCMYE